MKYLQDEEWNEDAVSGIRVADSTATDTAFSDKTQDDLYELEDSSWWFIYRANVVTWLMDKYFSRDKITIDIGGGNGYTPSVAKNMGFLTGLIEPNPAACRHAKARGIDEVNCGTVTEKSIIDGSIEQATLLDVLEHIEDDKGFIQLLHRKMSGGVLSLSQYRPLCAFGAVKMMQQVILEDIG